MLLNAVLRDEFDPVIRGRGEDYFRRGRIRSSVGNDVAVIAKVSGSRDYTVNVGRIGDEVELSCTCPYFEGDGACKHLWAVLLFAEAEGFLRGDGRPVRKVTLTDLDDFDDFDEDQARGGPRGRRRGRRRGRDRRNARGERRRLPPPARNQPRPDPEYTPRTGLRFGLGQASGPALVGERAPVGLHRHTRRIGSPAGLAAGPAAALRRRRGRLAHDRGHPRPLHARPGHEGWIPDSATDRPDARGAGPLPPRRRPEGSRTSRRRVAGRGRRDVGEFVGAAPVQVRPERGAGRAAAPGPLCGGPLRSPPGPAARRAAPVAWDDGSPWKLVLVCAREGGGDLVVRGVLRRGDEEHPLAEADFLTREGLLLRNASFAHWSGSRSFAWVVLLRRDGELRVPASGLARLLDALAAGAVDCEIELPEDVAIMEAARPPVPLLRLSLRPEAPGRAPMAFGTLAFAYDGREVDWGEPGGLLRAGRSGSSAATEPPRRRPPLASNGSGSRRSTRSTPAPRRSPSLPRGSRKSSTSS
ncbi:MAG: SWIM zinc finger family protein [Holophagales bacterium]|nr:SWIM zinc finger family protein [Holophagales bacterium]